MQNVNPEIIQFKKQRELGEILSDTFKFIRLEWKLLFTMILKIAGPALLIMLVAYIFYGNNIMGGFGMLEFFGAGSFFTPEIIISILVLAISGVVYYSLLYGTVLAYIRSYIKNNGVVDQIEVKNLVFQKFWSLMGLTFLVGIITFVGFLFCLIPGIYLGVVLGASFAILIFEDRDAMDTVSYSFSLIKNEWFATFATIFVVGLLYYFIMIIFQVPQYIYFFIKTFTGAEEISADPSQMFDGIYVTLTAISMVFQYLLYSIIVIASAFVYYNLNEKKNFTGTLEQIDSLGNSDFPDA